MAHSERVSLDHLPRNAFEVRGLLSDSECDALVKVVEARGLGDISWEYDPVRGLCSYASCVVCHMTLQRHMQYQLESHGQKCARSSVAWSASSVATCVPNAIPQKYRSCTRLVVSVPDLAAELWRRLRPLLHLEDIQNVRVSIAQYLPLCPVPPYVCMRASDMH